MPEIIHNRKQLISNLGPGKRLSSLKGDYMGIDYNECYLVLDQNWYFQGLFDGHWEILHRVKTEMAEQGLLFKKNLDRVYGFE